MAHAPLAVGAYGDSVARLQDFLHQQGFSLPASEVDRHFFGPVTRRALQQFQHQKGLQVSGAVDEPTASAMQAATAALSERVAEAILPKAVTPPTPGSASRPLTPPALHPTTPVAAPPSTGLIPV